MSAQLRPLFVRPFIRPVIRQMFPITWATAAGLCLCLAALAGIAIEGHTSRQGAPSYYLQGAAAWAGMWWLLLSSRWCELIHRMAPLRLPKVGRTLIQGMCLHLAASIAIPLAALPWWMPQGTDALALLAALWLGSAAGLLTVSMPAAIPLMPLAIMAVDWSLLSSTAWCAMAGLVLLCAAAMAWRWQLAGRRHALMVPFGVALAGVPFAAPAAADLARTQPARDHAPQDRAEKGGDETPSMTRNDVLAAFLGPDCQTIRQIHGRRARWLAYLVFATAAVALLCWTLYQPPGHGHGMFFAAVGVAVLCMLAQRPANRILALQQTQRAVAAQLMLTPGLPDAAALRGAMTRQAGRALLERLVLAGTVVAAASAAMFPASLAWLAWWACLTALVLLHAMASASLACDGMSRHGSWRCVGLTGLALSIGSNVLLLAQGQSLPLAWLLAWAAWMAAAGCAFWRLRGAR